MTFGSPSQFYIYPLVIVKTDGLFAALVSAGAGVRGHSGLRTTAGARAAPTHRRHLLR